MVPYLISGVMNLPQSIFLGGSSMLILIGFSLDTVDQLKSQLALRNYQGFLTRRQP